VRFGRHDFGRDEPDGGRWFGHRHERRPREGLFGRVRGRVRGQSGHGRTSSCTPIEPRAAPGPAGSKVPDAVIPTRTRLRTLGVVVDDPAADERPDIGAAADVTDRGSGGSPVGRRVFLGLVGLGAAGVLLGARAQEWLERAVGPLISKDGTGLASLLPIGRFRIYTVTGSLPSRSSADWSLKVDGLVDHPFELTYDELLAMPATDLTRDFQCVTGWRVPEVQWRGVQLSRLLDRAGVQPEAKALRFHSFDGAYTESLTLSQARRDDVIAAYRLEGEDLSDAHGGPVRLYVAPMYGYKSLKWLDRIELTEDVQEGYWEVRGYDVDAWVGRSNGRDDDAT
jgi:DMSO/TMAO reductase YedYZ molybdopterin-dependent catalytic subunit